ncbi:MAG: hypothetical protein ABJC13_02485 [Acidobacteriota bacterium]
MADRSYGGKLVRWQTMAHNIEDSVPLIPGADGPMAELREKLAELSKTHGTLVEMEGRKKELVQLRRRLDQETQEVVRRLASAARAHFGFKSPQLETFGVPAEIFSRRKNHGKRGPARKKPSPESQD